MRKLIERNTPEISDMFILRDIPSAEGKNTYEVFCEDGKIIICGDCKISMAMGYYHYLRRYCGVNWSHCGNTAISVTEAPLFEGRLSKVIKQDKRACLSYGALAYSCAFWTWEKWEKEIDFMAVNGINMPLSVVGSEAVWYYTMRDFTYSETGALSFLSGPGFWPWQLTCNLTGYFSLTDVKYIESRYELGKKIIERETELGMTPVQQGFSGMIPRSLSKLFKKIRMSMIKSWCNFPVTYQLDPSDPVFKKFGTALLQKQQQLFGSCHYFACDPFMGSEPAVKKKDYLWNMGRAIDTLYKDFDPDSVWVMQSRSVRPQIVKSVPKGRLLILDIGGEMYKETENFWGHDFVVGSVNSFGDRTALHGSIKELADNKYASVEAENCVGTGIFPEGLYQNPLYYDLAFQMLTEPEKIDLNPWLEDYAFRRYGSDEKCLADAVKLLYKSCYNENCTGMETGSTICARPSTGLKHTAPGDTRKLRYNNKDLYAAASCLASAAKAEKDGYIYDICDITRQVLSNYCSVLYDRTMTGFNTRDVNLFERSTNAFLKICDELDELLQTRPEFSLSGHLKQAGALALTDKDKENFELNLLTQITVWGPVGNPVNYDCAWKEWGGMVGTYYSKRWQSFFEALALQFPKKGKYSTETKKQIGERNQYIGSPFYKRYAEFERKWLSTVNPEGAPEGDTVLLAKQLIEKYEKVINYAEV